MSAAKEDVISPDEMRKRLYQTFKNRGVLDTLKTQLRNQLIQELKHPVLRGEVALKPVPVEADSVLVQASNSLVADHLRNVGYEYTLSVFYPECGLEKDKVFSTRDLLQLMKISPRSALYKSLTSSMQKDGTKGFLMKLLIELTDHHLHRERCDTDTQTDSTPQYRESLAEKLQMIDDQFAALHHQGNKWESLEAKLAEYRKEIEAQVQAEMNQQLQHFKEVELARLKLEEKEKSQKEVSELRREMERTYQIKSEALINREKNAIERLQKQQEIEEKEIYAQRQSLLKEIETVRNREAELKQRIEAFEMNCRLQDEKTKTTEEALRRRELAVKTIEDTYDQKLKNELLKYQLELKEEYLKRTEKVTEDEKRIKAESLHLRKELAVLDQKTEEQRRAIAEVKRLQVELDAAMSQISLLTQQTKLLKERLEETTDYPVLKRERLELQAQVRLITRHLEDTQEENRQFKAALRQPTAEYLALQTEVRKMENARKLDEEEFENQKQVLETQLQNEIERSAQLKAQLMECEERAEWLATHAEDVKMQLKQTQLALENEVFRNPKPSLVDRSVLDLTADRIVPPDLYVDGPVQKSRRVPGGSLFEPAAGLASTSQRHLRPRGSSLDPDTELVAGAKARIRELEKEAESLEEAYRNYQHRVIQAAALSAPPPGPQSPQQQHCVALSGISSASPSRVTFADDMLGSRELLSGQFNGHLLDSLSIFGGAETAGVQTPPERNSPRRLSSTPLSTSKRKSRRGTAEDKDHSHTASHHSLPEWQIPPRDHPSSSADISVLGSPPLKSTAREHASFQKPTEGLLSSGSSPPPEKISVQDLTEPSGDHSDIPKQLESDVSHQSGENMNRHSVTTPEPAIATSQQDLESVEHQAAEQQDTEEEEEAERWELERKQREARRLQERQEAMEREQRELERLMEEEQQHREPSLKGPAGNDTASKDPEGEEADPRSKTDPLEKYMKIVMQNKERGQQEPSSSKEAREQESSIAEILSEKDESIAALSHDDADDDFW
uniref:OFD1 centriole and centriolar satellite protein n=1 Tax=Lepisosteus oculatus TaxID=7918 RepID=W5MV79_LEPOC|nr:PREDICTED: oral-facial-digital syndrome 1 protein isoform X1 [Lepisosteus oculatus]XP_015217094.1 PREDICTED: oral-facial-digital syndrome 1 protein isoform X1 [Lepisosteus oculatus]